jgi:hypothetical protein
LRIHSWPLGGLDQLRSTKRFSPRLSLGRLTVLGAGVNNFVELLLLLAFTAFVGSRKQFQPSPYTNLEVAASGVRSVSRSIPVRAGQRGRTGVKPLAREHTPTVPWPLTPSYHPGCLGQSRWLSVSRPLVSPFIGSFLPSPNSSLTSIAHIPAFCTFILEFVSEMSAAIAAIAAYTGP